MRENALVIQSRVINALIIRDMKTRFGGNPANFVIAIAWPLSHLLVLLLIYAGMGRAAPYGNSSVLFFSAGLLPYIIFMYPARFAMMALGTNAPLLSFPIVTAFDIVLARIILEIVGALAVILVLALLLLALDVDILPVDGVAAVAAIGSTLLLAAAFGFINALIFKKIPGYLLAWVLFQITVYIASGIIFLPDGLPKWALDILAWNPLLHSVAWFRSAYYPGYGALYLDRTYLVGFGLTVLVIAMILQRALRTWLLSS